MNRRRADTVVGVFLGFVLLAGGALSWRAYRQRRAIEQSMGFLIPMASSDQLDTTTILLLVLGAFILIPMVLSFPVE